MNHVRFMAILNYMKSNPEFHVVQGEVVYGTQESWRKLSERQG